MALRWALECNRLPSPTGRQRRPRRADCGLLGGKRGGALRGRFAPAVCLVCKTPAWRLKRNCSSRPFGEYLSILTVICYLPSRCRISGLHITIKQPQKMGFERNGLLTTTIVSLASGLYRCAFAVIRGPGCLLRQRARLLIATAIAGLLPVAPAFNPNRAGVAARCTFSR